jgi:integrase
MCKNLSPISEIIGYSLPKLHKGKKWFVDFRAYDPAAQTMRRKKYHIPDDLKVRDKIARANLIIATLTQKLASGWNPFASADGSRGYTLFADVMDKYALYLTKFGRAKTKHSYSSRLHILSEYINKTSYPIVYAYQFDTAFVTAFLDYIYIDRQCGARTRNNYRGWCSSFADWMLERGFISDNPTRSISKISETAKERQPLTADQLSKLYNYLLLNDKPFLLACLFEYFTFIRPTELTHIRVNDISIKESRIFVSKEYSKNKKDGYVALNPLLVRLLLDVGSLTKPGHYYLFGKGFLPSEHKAAPDIFNKRWARMRKFFSWSESLQFYSLKDSGIRDLSNSAGIVYARDQARHSDISTTNKYIQGKTPIPEATRNFIGAFGND